LFFVFLAYSANLTAQSSSQAAGLYEKAKAESLKRRSDYDELSNFLIESIQLETQTSEPDFRFIGKCRADLAHAYDLLEKPQAADEQLWEAALSFSKANDVKMARWICSKISKRFPKAVDVNSVHNIFPQDSLLTSSELYSSILSVFPTTVDSFQITINIGSNMGAFVGQKGSILTAFHKMYKERGNEVFGEFEIIHVTPYQCKAIAVRTSVKKLDLLPGDNARLFIKTPKIRENNLLAQLSKLNILFLNNEKAPFFHASQLNYITQEKYDRLLLEVMLDDVKSTAQTLYDPSDSTDSLKKILTDQRFEGMNMWEAMLNSTIWDIKAFFRFVNAFPAKYMGRSFRLDETYATWLINNAPSSNSSSDQSAEAKSLYLDYLDIQKFDFKKWLHANAYYLNNAHNLDSVFNANINLAMDNKSTAEAQVLATDLKSIATKTKNSRFLNTALTSSGHIFRMKEQYDSSIASYTSAMKLNIDTLNLYWWRGYVYEKRGHFGKALEDYQHVIDGAPNLGIGYGSFAWVLIQTGKFKKAKTFCLKAYNLNPEELAWTVNLGHCYLFLDDLDSAKILYENTLTGLRSVASYEEGISADFQLFLENGWSEVKVSEVRQWVQNEWENHYQFKAIAKNGYDLGIDLLRDKKFKAALDKFKIAIENEEQGKSVDQVTRRIYERYAGVCFFKLQDYAHALQHYKNAWQIGRDNLANLEFQQEDLEDISYIYSVIGDKMQSAIFKELENGIGRKLNALSNSNNLYVMTIGINDYPMGKYKYAEKDASEMASALTNDAKLVFDSVSVVSIFGKEATKQRIRMEFEKIIRSSRTGDCFILYFAGDANKSELLLNEDTIESWEVNLWLKSLRAKDQLLIFDSPTFSFSNELNPFENSQSTMTDTRNLMVLSNRGSRIELEEIDNGLMTHHIKNGLYNDSPNDNGHIYISAKNIERYLFQEMKKGAVPFDLISYSSGREFDIAQRIVEVKHRDTIAPSIMLTTANVTRTLRGGKSRVSNTGDRIEGRVSDEHGIAALYINGERINFSENGRFSINATHLIDGNLQIRAVDHSGNVATRSYDFIASSIGIKMSSSSSQNAKNYAVLIATDEYDEWSDLNNPISDVEAIGKLLEENFGFEVDILRNLKKQTLQDTLFHYMSRDYGPKDQLLLFFAGHGINDPNLAGQIVCKDSKVKDRRSLPTYIPFSFITDNFDRNNCKHVFLAMDVCFGGAYFDQNFAPKYEDSTVSRIGIEAFIDRKAKYQSRQFLTSGKDEYVSDGAPGGHSPFAYSFIETLESGRNKKYLTLVDFVNRMRMIETEINYGTFGNHHRDGEFVLKYRENPNKRLAESEDDPTN